MYLRCFNPMLNTVESANKGRDQLIECDANSVHT